MQMIYLLRFIVTKLLLHGDRGFLQLEMKLLRLYVYQYFRNEAGVMLIVHYSKCHSHQKQNFTK